MKPSITMTKTATRFFVKPGAIFNRCVVATAALLLSLSVQAESVSGSPNYTELEAMSVGEVSLVIGKAYLLSADKSRQLVKKGSQLKAGDQILTQANGHVHVRFVDNALLSIRPDSQLEITSYDYNAEQPEKSSFKYNLVEGVMRAISGKGAKADRSRFRLNTPVAAIGVRGTDFVVSATEQTTRALVNEGAIVVAPYSAECTAAAFGPCATNALELTDNSLQIIELDGTAVSPRLIPPPNEREPSAMRQEVQLAIAKTVDDAEDKTAGTEVYLENVTSRKAVEQVAVASVTAVDFTPDAPQSSTELAPRQLLWGRWREGLGELERITLSYAEASEGREATIGGFGYGLYRNATGIPQVERGLGPVGFSLNSAQAFYDSSSGVVAMQVNGGSLDIDFDQSLFATELNLNHVDTGIVNFMANGSISDNGYFVSRTASQHLGGAVSRDGREAGYFFQQQLEGGNIQGLTLWDSK